jgi:uncharacterized membrane protein YkvA (DUF1232 family)
MAVWHCIERTWPMENPRPPCLPDNTAMRPLLLIRKWATALKRDVLLLWFALRHPRTPLAIKGLGALILAYALSPIDLIPDFIPVLGYLDELVLLPGLIWLAVRLLPLEVLEDCRKRAAQWAPGQRLRRVVYAGAALVIGTWTLLALWLARIWLA